MCRRLFTAILISLSCLLVSVPAFAATDAPQIPLNQRIYFASRVYASLVSNFAHMQGAPDVDVEAAYRRYLDKVIAADTRSAFTLASMEFLASMRNGHTVFVDQELARRNGALPFTARYSGTQWIVTESQVPDLKPGDVIEKIDGRPFEQFFVEIRPHISASSDYSARHMLFVRMWDMAPFGPLFPEKFELALSGNRKVAIDRRAVGGAKVPPTEGRWLKPGEVAYIRIPSFFFPENEKRALELLEEFRRAHAIIVDLRGNPGGSTPSDLTSHLMERPYRWWSESTPINMPFFRYRASQGDWHYQAFRQPQIIWYSGPSTPAKDAFTGKLVLLVDGGCNSACEDFTMPFKDNHRATLVGQNTSGSTGEPFVTDFGNGMLVLIGAKRAAFPDGMPFEGVGIKPDIEVQPTAEDLANGRDAALATALRVCNEEAH